MVRKTKEDAAITRQRIIDAARDVFLVRGVSRTSMEQIAAQAGVTRGAIYWHFDSKTEILLALRERVFLPLIDRMDDTLLKAAEGAEDPLLNIERFLTETIQVLNDSSETRQTYEIMMIKCEYVDEFAQVLQQIANNCSNISLNIKLAYQRAQELDLLDTSCTPEEYAMDTYLFFSGLLHMWIKDPEDSERRQQTKNYISTHIRLRRKKNSP
jgi:TetR/AcrR family transcriptional regulator, acrAB operon repressor